jgi:hypothetical protein
VSKKKSFCHSGSGLKERKTAKRNDGARETTRALCGEHEHACKTNRQIKRRESHSTLCERFRREKTLARYKTLAVSAPKRRDARRTKEQKKTKKKKKKKKKGTHAMAISSASFSIAACAVLFDRCRADIVTFSLCV